MSRKRKVNEAEIKEDYESYRRKIIEDFPMAYDGTGLSTLETHFKELNQLYSKVKRDTNLSLHYADSKALIDTTSFASVTAKNMRFADSEVFLTTNEFVRKVRHFLQDDSKKKKDGEVQDDDEDIPDAHFNEEHFNSLSWLSLGLLYVKASNKPIPMEFLNGPLYAEKKVIVRSKTVDDTKGLQRTTAQNVDADEIQNDKQPNTAKLVSSTLKYFTNKQNGDFEPVNFFKFFINPQSFSQSVENLFFTSFLIRDGRLKLYKDKDGIPMILNLTKDVREAQIRQQKASTNSHHIASFDYDTWLGLIETFDITECYLGHRDTEIDDWNPQDDEEGEDEDEEEEDDEDEEEGQQDDDDDEDENPEVPEDPEVEE